MRLLTSVPLAPRCTLGVGGPAARFAEVASEADVADAARDAAGRGEPLFVLGGGSNVLVADAGVPGTTIAIANRGITRRRVPRSGAPAGTEQVELDVAAGEPWDAFVEATVGEGLVGLECLAGIPGLVGGTPIQNVGAYGREVGPRIVSVRAYDRTARGMVDLSAAACGFGYRASVLKHSSRWIVTSVRFRLDVGTLAEPPRYAELERALGLADGQRASARTVRETVVALRRAKGMVLDPADPDTASAGSFFTNPVVDDAALARVLARVRERLGDGAAPPTFPEPGGRTKLAAGWLIERAGIVKGFALPGSRARVSTKHALALTNAGGASALEVAALACHVRAAVEGAFGVRLEPEPVLVGMSLDGA